MFLRTLFSKNEREIQEYVYTRFRELNKWQNLLLTHPDKHYSTSIARRPEVRDKNRYTNILPYNYNRVQLLYAKDFREGYINASYVEPVGFNTGKRYIVTQGPLEDTMGDFWEMVFQQRTQVIVCLTPPEEGGREKCARYYPERHQFIEFPARGPMTKNGRITTLQVHLREDEPETIDDDAYAWVRHIRLSFLNEDLDVLAETALVQLHFYGWRDHDVPDDTAEILALSRLADKYNGPGAGPMVVHCSAGCGRSGAFCVINSGMQLIDRDSDALQGDFIYALTSKFRKQRTTMVQTSSQYMFCHQALRDAYQQKNNPPSQ
ncbi:protein-tyrosine phosphatase-like protein [Syncephalastrum racemosum]|uniref:Protein-tyrosine phosphatase-like protein n=1 Tax=Syncephalastrum racemosum TaxID=13706 RepID=A0A1X2HDH2_SYNRA|nr:protein-tyrosine phosphatase-like protein [Syncephalastrum racemosum]